MNKQQPEAGLPTERFFTVVYKLTDANTAKYLSNRDWVTYVYADSMAELRRQHARITELESQLAQRFDAADMATASAQGFMDGVASLSANAGEPRNAIDRDALIDAIAQGLHGTWHCTRVWEAWHVGTMSQDDFEPVDESETPTEIADAVLALLAAQPAAQQGVAYAALPEKYYLAGGEVLTWDAKQMHAFADATHTLRASRGQAPAKPDPAYSGACNLATELFKKHFAHLPEYASGQAVWGLFDSTEGVILQIDNMVSGLVQPPTTTPQADSVQEDAARYRWLAASCRSTSEHWGGRWSIIIDGPAPKSHDSEDDFDAAVDAARKQGATP